MRGPYPSSPLALKLRRLRSRFGIAAPRVTVRTYIPWYWRALGLVLLGALGIALAGWVYDAGRRIAGYDSTESSQEIGALREKVAELEGEVVRLRAANNASESSLQIERTAQSQLTAQVKSLEAENNRLKEENAVFERLSQGGGGREGQITVSRLRVYPEGGGGRYRYQFLVAQNGESRGREFKGSVQVVAHLPPGSPDAIMVFPRADDPDPARFAVVFKHFRSIDGAFTLPAGVKPKSFEIRVVQDGAVRAVETVTL